MAEPSKRVLLLRSAVLLLKLATLTFNVKLNFLPPQQVSVLSSNDFELPRAVRSLWYMITPLAVALIATGTEQSDATTCNRDADQEEETLAVALLEHLVLTLRQGVTKDPIFRLMAELPHTVACLRLLAAVVHTMHPKVMRREVKRLGTASTASGSWCHFLCVCFATLPMHALVTSAQARLRKTCFKSGPCMSLLSPILMSCSLQLVHCLHVI